MIEYNIGILGAGNIAATIADVLKNMNGFCPYAIASIDEAKAKEFAEKQIDISINNILDAKFDISPIKKDTDKDITACKFCNYKDICFRTNEDIRNLKKDNELSFLGGDENA